MTTLAAYAFGLFYITWILYIAGMNIVRVWDDLRLPIKILLSPAIIIFLFLDAFFINFLILTALFKEIPDEWLASTRLDRHARGSHRSNRAKAIFFRGWFLSKFDPTGGHG